MDSITFLYLLQEKGQQPSGLMQMLPLIVGLFLIMYFVMIRPQMKEQKKRRQMLASLKKHDHVLTTGGIFGTVVSIGDNEIVLKIAENVRVKFSRSAVTAVIPKNGDEDKKDS